MNALAAVLGWDVRIQARSGFYWATAFIILVVSALLLVVPEALRADRAAWVPALVAINLQITTFFFVTGLLLMERDEGTLLALAVSPMTPRLYLTSRIVTLTALAAAETFAMVWIAFGLRASWIQILAGTAALGAIYTCCGVIVGSRYGSVNSLLLPAGVIVTGLLLPLLPHFGFTPRWPFLLHPIEPPLTLLRAGYAPASVADISYGILGSVGWAGATFWWARRCIERLMAETEATGGR